MAKNAGGAPADKLALYEKLVATFPGIERKGATVTTNIAQIGGPRISVGRG